MAVRKPLVMIGGVVRGLPAGDSISGAVEDNDPRLSDAREWTASEVSQAEAEAGTATTARKWTAQRVRQAVTGWWSGIGTAFGKSLLSLADAAAGRTALGLENVNNTSDADKPISTATANALNGKFDKTGGVISGLFGYGPGAGGAVVQPTSKSTAVTLNKPCGMITMHAQELAAGSSVGFQLLNDTASPGDLVVLTGLYAVVNPANYRIEAVSIGSPNIVTIRVTNISSAALSEELQIQFAIIKGATS